MAAKPISMKKLYRWANKWRNLGIKKHVFRDRQHEMEIDAWVKDFILFVDDHRND